MDAAFALSGLFGAAFLAATLFPFASEPVFVAVQLLSAAPVWAVLAVASLGNTLGAFVNYWIGRQLDRPGLRARLKLDEARLAPARRWWARWGVWSLLLAALPVIGWVTVLAGAMRTPLWLFAGLVAVSKTLRYLLLALATAGAAGLG